MKALLALSLANPVSGPAGRNASLPASVAAPRLAPPAAGLGPLALSPLSAAADAAAPGPVDAAAASESPAPAAAAAEALVPELVGPDAAGTALQRFFDGGAGEGGALARIPVKDPSVRLAASVPGLYAQYHWPASRFTPDGKLFYGTGYRVDRSGEKPEWKRVFFGVESETGRVRFETPLEKDVSIEGMTASPSGRYALARAQMGWLTVVDLKTGELKTAQFPWVSEGWPTYARQKTAFFPEFEFGPSGDLAHWGSDDGGVHRLDPAAFLAAEDPFKTIAMVRPQAPEKKRENYSPYATHVTRSWVFPRQHDRWEFTEIRTGRVVTLPSKAKHHVLGVQADKDLVYLSEERNGAFVILRYDLNADKLEDVWTGPGQWYGDNALSPDGSHIALVMGRARPDARGGDAVVIDLRSGREKIRVMDFSRGGHSNNFNRNVHASGTAFVFGSANPQVLVTYDYKKDELDQLMVDPREDLRHGAGGSLSYAANYYVNPAVPGLTLLAPGSVDGVPARPGFYLGSRRLPADLLPEELGRAGYVAESPDGRFFAATVVLEKDKPELRILRVER